MFEISFLGTEVAFPSRASDIDDLILNAFGVIVGYGMYTAFKRLQR